jgi:hypothetical protein
VGPVEIGVLLLYAIPFLFAPIAVAAWIYHDASHRSIDHPIAWAIAGFVSWVSTLPVYYALRDHLRTDEEPPHSNAE